MLTQEKTSDKIFTLRPRRSFYAKNMPAAINDLEQLSDFNLIYRTLCSILFNFAPNSGHPGGSVSSGHIVGNLVLDTMDYDLAGPDREDNDLLFYAAGHKAMGLYAMWALRNEFARIAAPHLLAPEQRQLRLEDLLGFRRNPTQDTPLFKRFNSKTLDGHPTCAAPFVAMASGPSGVGIPGALGYATAARDYFGADTPKIHILEGEGGMTPGRVHEALACAATTGLANVILHVDWNQASIDSNKVCAEGDKSGDYVQWDPMELLRVHDWNVIEVADGHDFAQVASAQKAALTAANGQPTAVVYRTTKGWRYGVEGKASHGGGHAYCSLQYHDTLKPFEERFAVTFPEAPAQKTPQVIEDSYWKTLLVIRKTIEDDRLLHAWVAGRLTQAKKRLDAAARKPKSTADLDAVYRETASVEMTPTALVYPAGKPAATRAALGKALGHLNAVSHGALLACAADLLDSTSVSGANDGFPKGFHHTKDNPGSRLVSVGGICEDSMGAFMAGVSSFGRHIGVTSSYASFITPLEHIAARVHSIGQQARKHITGQPYRTWIMVNAHAGPMTGEDGPTHADPQALQLLQDNFPKGTLITLTPWEAQEVWPLLAAGLKTRPTVLAPYVTRPAENVVDRVALKMPPAHAATKGLYAVRRTDATTKTVVLQGCGVMTFFTRDVLPKLDAMGLAVNVFYVSSAELFNLLPESERLAIYPEALARDAMGVTDFTLATMWRWVRSDKGLAQSLYPFKEGNFLGSGNWQMVLGEGGLNPAAQLKAIESWLGR
ncbi:MAG: hypothetical protein AABZ44_03775 [Elusimicrobiota bacterium]